MLFADVIMNYGFFRKTNIVNVTSLGYFWKFLSNKYLTKVAQTFYHFGAIFKLISFYVKTCFDYFFVSFWKQFGYFPFQHLVTLNIDAKSSFRAARFTINIQWSIWRRSKERQGWSYDENFLCEITVCWI